MAKLSDPFDYADTTNTSHDEAPATPDDLNLLTETDEKKVTAAIVEEWDSSTKLLRSHSEEWKVNRARENGYTGVRLIKKQDEQKAYIPLGATPNGTIINKAARLKRRLRSVMFNDPPLAECTPASDEDEDRDSAEFGNRVIADLSSESQLDLPLVCGDAFDLGGTYGSGFVRFWVDPKGGGWRPKQVKAHPLAPTLDAATTDPLSGMPAGPDALVERFVGKGGALTDDRAAAEPQWLPKLQSETLTGRHVRLIPFTCRDLWDAEAVLVGAMVPLTTAKRLPGIAALKPEELEKLVSSRPADAKDLIPAYQRQMTPQRDNDKLVFVLSRYQRQTAEYPKGGYWIVVGTDKLAWRGPWYDEKHDRPLDLPLTQFMHLYEEDNPYGKGIMTVLGPGNELLAQLMGAMLDHLDRFTHRKTFLPLSSNLQPQQLQSETATVIPIIPGGQPVYEDLPRFPPAVQEMHAQIRAELDDESSLQQAGQGVNTPAVQSGLHAQVIVEQVHVNLSEMRQHTERGLVRAWRVILQLVRAFYQTSQQIKWVGEDGAYKVREWTGSDLGSTADVQIHKGSFTLLAPTAKAALTQTYLQTGLIDLPTAKRLIGGQVGGLLGLEDDPHRLRVRRQISAWREGPPLGWAPTAPDPQTGQAAPDPSSPFVPLAVDDEQVVALVRTEELGRAMASSRFGKYPPEWQALLAAEYVKARQAAGIQTVAEAQQAMAAQQQAQQQAAAAQQPPAQEPSAAVQEAHRAELEKVRAEAATAKAEAGMKVLKAREVVTRELDNLTQPMPPMSAKPDNTP